MAHTNIVLKKCFNPVQRFGSLVLTRNLFSSNYLDSVNFQIQRRKLRKSDGQAEQTKHKIMNRINKYGLEGTTTQDIHLLIHCIEPDRFEDMSFLTQLLIEDSNSKVRKIQSSRMFLSLFFWMCYRQTKD